MSDDFPNAIDEYDSYALEIVTAVATDISVSALAELLVSIVQHRMGLRGQPQQPMAERLRVWHTRSKDRYDRQHRDELST